MTKDRLKNTEIDIEKLTGDLLPQADNELKKLFAQAGSSPPRIIWSPKSADYSNPLIALFADACHTLAQPDGRVLAEDFDVYTFRPLQEWLMHVDIEDGGKVFRYLHYGDAIANIHGRSLLGKTTKAFGGHVSLFFTAIHNAVLHQQDWMLTIHTPPQKVFARQWELLIVPLFDDAGAVVQFIVLNVPDNKLRPGLDIIPDPVLIVDADMIVRYANRIARETFGHQDHFSTQIDLFTYSGIDIEMPAAPHELAKSYAVHDVVSLVLRDTIIQRFMLTISATEQWGTACYVITMRPAAD